MRKFFLLTILLAFGISAASAEIYRWKDKYGNDHFSDRPKHGAEKVKLSPTQTYKPVKVSEEKTEVSKDDNKKKVYDYSEFKILSPLPNATFRGDSEGRVMVIFALPKLDDDHHFVLTMDGKDVSEPSKSIKEIELQGIVRGQHILVGEIRDNKNNVIQRSNRVVFFMKLPFVRRAPLSGLSEAKQQPMARVNPALAPIQLKKK